MNKRLLALILVFLMCLSVIHLPNELGFQAKSFSDSDGDGFDDSVDPCPDSEGTWLTTVIDSADGSGNGGLSIALDSNDNPRIAYHQSEQNSLRHANYSDGQWSLSTIAIGTDAGIGVDIEINQNDSSVFAYTLGYDIILYNEETGIHPKSVKGYSSVYGAIELEIDSQDRAFATYRSNTAIDPSISTNGQYFISFDTTGDDSFLQATGNQYHSLETLPSGELVVIVNGLLYTDLMNEYSGQVSGQDTGSAIFDPSLSSRSDGSLGYVSAKGHNGATTPDIVEYRTIIDGVVESVETVEEDTGVSSVRERTELSFDSNDKPHLVYSRSFQQGFTYAQKENGVWNLSTIDSESGTIRNPVIEIDSKNQVHIAYHRDDSGALVYTTKSMTDSDGDGCLDHEDAFPDDDYEQFDNDGDGIGDNEESTGRVYSINPVNGTQLGGTEVTITGSGFESLVSQETDNVDAQSIPMLGYWPLDEQDSAGYFQDHSGNDWDMVPEGQPSFDQPGIINDSIKFLGDDKLITPGTESYFSGLGQMSVSAWINPTSLGDSGDSNSQTNRMIMTQNAAWYLFLRYTPDGTVLVWEIHGNVAVESTTTFNTDTWYHVSAAWDGDHACVYINAVAEGCTSYANTMPTTTNGHGASIGAQSGGSDFYGFIDDVRLYGTHLISSDIQSLYQFDGNDSGAIDSEYTLQAHLSTSDWNETVNMTYVDNHTLTFITPAGPEGETVDLTLVGNGKQLVINDAYTFDSSAIDSDGDGILDNLDDCPYYAGNSSADRIGCLDSDGDGYSDIDGSSALQDKFPFDGTQWSDYDDDNYGDNYANQSWELTRPVEWPGVYVEGATEQDACPGSFGNSTAEATYGCPDSDGDTYADQIDSFTDDYSQWSDIDGDGYGDNSSVNATTPDSCPSIWGNSTFDRYGCLDSDGDGMSDDIDDFPLDAERTSDVDQDGLDDRFDDNCPNTYNPLQEDLDGDGMGDLCDTDEDGDGIHDGIDNCPQGITDWTSGVLLDYDGDGCLDGAEDSDDDGDGVVDGMDGCPKGDFGWESSLDTDHDSDGCNDESEDLDDDADGKDDSKDSCPKGANDWSSTTLTDLDADGCRDSDEDLDDDGDGVNDENDSCPTGLTQWVSDPMSDADADGCHDDLDSAPTSETDDETESFIELLTSGNLDAIGVVLAVLLPIVGISVSVMLRKRKTAVVQSLGESIDNCKSVNELDAMSNELMELVTKDNISQAQYDVLKFKIEGRRSAIHSETYVNPSEVTDIGTDVPGITAIGYNGNDGYEWLDHNGTKWYRLEGSSDEWLQWAKN